MANEKFAFDMSEWANKTKAEMITIRKKISLELFRDIVMDTPVDKGSLRANWMGTLDNPSDETTDAIDTTGGATLSKIANDIDSLKGDESIFLTNNLPYGSKVEDGLYPIPGGELTENGFSKKAPQGMVKKNIPNFTGYVEKFKRE